MKRSFAPAVLAGLIAVLVLVLGSQGAGAAQRGSVVGSANKMVIFSSDGMRPDLMQRYAAAGAMPTYAKLMRDGVIGANGMQQAFPPNTGVGWYSMATGTWPSEHGSTNNTFFRAGDAFTNRTSFSASGVLQADTIAASAERAGKKVAQIDWVGGVPANINGPTVDFTNFFSNRGVVVGAANAAEQSGAAAFGVTYQVAAPATATGWSNVPAGDPAAPPQEVAWTIPTTFAAQNPTRTYNVYFYDSNVNGTVAYNRVIVSTSGKDGTGALTLAVGDFKPLKVELIGARAGQKAGHYIKLISLAPDLSNYKLYDTSIARAIATCRTAACNALPAGGASEDRLEKYIADTFVPWVAADFAPLEGRVIDEDTYVQQGRDLEKKFADDVMEYILKTLQPDTDLALVGYPVTDEFSHQFMALYTPTDIDGDPNPTFDDSDYNGVPDGRTTIREGYVRSAYHEADAKLGLARELMGGNPTTFAMSDHGFAPQWYAVNARKVLFDGSVNGTSLQASGGNTASNCGAVASDLAKGCWAGGTIQIYVNPTLPSGTTTAQVKSAVVTAFQNLADPANPGAKVVDAIYTKEQLRNVQGVDALHPNRSGDVVVVLRPPYQSDAGTPGQAIALSNFFGQHGYLPDLVDIAHNVNMHATFVAAGAGIRHQDSVSGIRSIDAAPTAALLLGVPGPQNARGKILYNLFPNPGQLREVTILDISDYHGQLIPLSEASDNLAAPAVNPTYGIGGSAFLKPWFDWYRAQAPNGSLTIAAGDSVGATPPISSFFGDKPTIEFMNLMGFGLDGLGNHNFDRGQQYLRTQLIPLAKFPYVSANVVDSSGKTPAEWSPSKVFDTFGGVKVGIVGFTNDDAPTLVSGSAFAPFHVENSTAAVNAEAARLKDGGINTIVAIGHLGATGGTLTAPTGPLVGLADAVQNVDAVIGDHTDIQVLAQRSNGVLVTENRSKGIRFTRVRLVVDTTSKEVVYKTADFHKPWDIGITPDPAIQARINELNGILAPILSEVLGNSTKYIPRADACGNGNGRTCESLVGNVTTDSMRTTYGTDFAITNSGGLRADLTCPTTDNPDDFCPAYTPPPYPITRERTVTVLPFGNFVVTASVSGAELKTMLENGVSRMPAVDGRFPQVSGLCFTYNIAAAAGSRVTSAVRQAADGSCTGAPINLLGTTPDYTVAINDFMASGGDGYPVLSDRVSQKALMEQVLADYIKAKGTISPVVLAAPNGRINCTGATCPALTPSP
jgi:2',3'-cyclic-nucleotide 2'-phosphodiesterase (5'-nucleotidase family)